MEFEIINSELISYSAVPLACMYMYMYMGEYPLELTVLLAGIGRMCLQ